METKEDQTATGQEPAPLPTAGKASPITLRLNNAGQAWEEFNAMATTPPPVQPDPLRLYAPGHQGRTRVKRRRLGYLAAAVVGIGLGVALVALKLSEAPSAKVPPSSSVNAPVQAKPQEAEAELAPTPAAAPAAIPSAQHEKQSAKISATSDISLEGRHKKTETSRLHGHPSPGREEPAEMPVNEPTATVYAKPASEPIAKPAAGPVEEFGMDLKRPTTRHQTKTMDEKDPYSP
jgi:hypothetical protein